MIKQMWKTNEHQKDYRMTGQPSCCREPPPPPHPSSLSTAQSTMVTIYRLQF